MAIVRPCPNCGTATVPDVPAGADIVSWKDPSSWRQRETSGPAGVGTWPCAHVSDPVCGAMTHVRYPEVTGRVPSTYPLRLDTGPVPQPCARLALESTSVPSWLSFSHSVAV